MTGNELIRQLRKIKGKVFGAVTGTDDVYYFAIEKADVILTLKHLGDQEAGLTLRQSSGLWYLER